MNLVNKCAGFGVVLVAIATACAAPTIPPEELGNKEGDQTASLPKKKEGPKSSPTQDTDNNEPAPSGQQPPGSQPPPPGEPPPAGNCAASASADACYTCCDPTNAVEPAFVAFDTCACQTPGVCAAQCGATYCAGQQPSAECITCLDGATQCAAAADAACTTACQAAFTCVDTSKCDDKP